jgi:CRISPR/Cas system-associated endonuclease Cas1
MYVDSQAAYFKRSFLSYGTKVATRRIERRFMSVGLRPTLGSFPKQQENCSRLVFA